MGKKKDQYQNTRLTFFLEKERTLKNVTVVFKRSGLVILFGFMGASGVGKSAIQHSLPIRFLTNYTTRRIREGEVAGYHINQVTREEFIQLDKAGKILEKSEYAGNLYGTPTDLIHEMLWYNVPFHATKDLNGIKALKESLGHKLITIYVQPPSIDDLVVRMIARGDHADTVRDRIVHLRETNELDNAKYADYVIINDKLQDAIFEAHRIVLTELTKAITKCKIY